MDAKLQVTFDPPTVAGYRLIGYDDRALRRSPYGGEVNLNDLVAIASLASERTGDPAVAELATLIRRTNG
jgi:hypothetical protein